MRTKKNQEKYNNPPEKYLDELEGGKYFVYAENVFNCKFAVGSGRVREASDDKLIRKIMSVRLKFKQAKL
jgi:hypothetical protein